MKELTPARAEVLRAPTEEQRERYKVAYRAYRRACDTLHEARADWLPEPTLASEP